MLTAHDRCDRCGAQACVVALFEVTHLFFCAHHARKYRDELMRQAIELYDGTGLLAGVKS